MSWTPVIRTYTSRDSTILPVELGRAGTFLSNLRTSYLISAVVVLAHDEFPPCPHRRVLCNAQLLHISGALFAPMHTCDAEFIVG